MASCPHCQTALADDFGLLECSNCGASVFVGMDGEVVQGNASSVEPTVMVSATEEAPAFVPEPETEPELPLQPTYEAVETPVENWQLNSTEEALAEVADFGNQDNVYQQEGPLSYIVTLSGIDSSDLQDRVKEVLTDKRLVLDMERLLPELKKGKLKITGLSPVKTYVLVSKIYDLPIAVEWEQHVLSE